MKVRPSAWFMSLLLLAACPKDETGETAETEKTTEKTSSTGTTAPVATATTPAPTAATTESAPKPAGIEAKVKAEVDNKPDGITNGNKMNAANAKAGIQAPKEWKVTPGETSVAKSADEKARVAVTGFGAEGPDQRMAQATQAAGLSACQWTTPPEQATVGKDKLPASVADGVCNRGAGQVKAAMMATEGLLVLGSWDEGGDQASVFNAFRSVTKAAVGVDSLAACCAALRQNSKSAPPQYVGAYLMAAGACDNARKSPDAQKALAGIRGMLRGANVPSSCR